MRLEIKIVNNFKDDYIDSIYDTYCSVGWFNKDEKTIKEIFTRSSHISIALYNNEVIGLARALSDGIYNAAIYDLVVKDNYQKLNIGRKILENILLEIGDLSCIHLISTTGNCEFYYKAGFRKLKTGMAIYQNSKLKEEYTE